MMHACVAFLTSAVLFLSQAGGTPPPVSVWRNPSNSVHIRAAPCGAGVMCATVIWANDKAKADARRGGTETLIGTQLFRNFKATGRNQWKGEVFVPDLNHTFGGTVTPIDDDHLLGKGCTLFGTVCKEQIWTRIRQ
ncbi:DUF2147 domain-containing protein [Sphingomonas hengshuiensis]|nr:DUF2147 domain-containing protein [Sphingomonas hengshuiensis]